MFSLTIHSPHTSAERMAQDVKKETDAFFACQATNAINRLRERGLDVSTPTTGIGATATYVECTDDGGAKMLLRVDSVRNLSGNCIGCIGTTDCYLGCARSTSVRALPENKTVTLFSLPCGSQWQLRNGFRSRIVSFTPAVKLTLHPLQWIITLLSWAPALQNQQQPR